MENNLTSIQSSLFLITASCLQISLIISLIYYDTKGIYFEI